MGKLIIEAPSIGEYVDGLSDIMVAALENVIFNVLAGLEWEEAIEVETEEQNFADGGIYSAAEEHEAESMFDDLITIADVIMEWEDTLSIDNVREKFMLKYLAVDQAPVIEISCLDNDTLVINVKEYPLLGGDDDWIEY